MSEEELREEIARLKREIEQLRMGNADLNPGMVKKKAEVAGGITDTGIFNEEIKKTVFSNRFDSEEVRVTSYFSVKGHRLDKEKVYRCSFCGIILTENEKIEINNRIYCEECYREKEHDLDKDDYKILFCILNGLTSTSSFLEYFGYVVTIQRVTGIAKSDVESRIEKLLNQGYLFLHGTLFKSIRVSSKGEEALAAYSQIYRDADIKRVKERAMYSGV